MWAPITARCTDGGALCGGADSPRPRAGRSATCGRSEIFSAARPDGPRLVAGRSAPGGRTVPACAEVAAFANSTWIRPLGRDPVREEGS
jgi:hypothetical protein